MKHRKGKGLKDFLRQRAERPSMALCRAVQDVEDSLNVGAAFRIADACGVDSTPPVGDTQSA